MEKTSQPLVITS